MCSPMSKLEQQQPSPVAAEPAVSVPSESHKRADSPGRDHGEAKKARHGDEQPVTPPMNADDAMVSTDERAPKTPRVSEAPHQKQMLQVTSTDLSLYEHEDSAAHHEFSNDDLDGLEQYDLEFYDDEYLAEDDNNVDDDMSKALAELTFPYSNKEPHISPDELLKLDAFLGRPDGSAASFKVAGPSRSIHYPCRFKGSQHQICEDLA